MADEKRRCPLCHRKVWTLDTDMGRIWEIHVDKDGAQCGASGAPATTR